ncbi:MAG: CBS domain-containing protein [Flavobacteriales bacterium]|jgi:CBS domain containing-hemolysin-like protein|nr:CBS domain-containing protein [Flavobacteriales bacterium]
MSYLEYISTDIDALKLNDSIKKAKSIFATCTLSHLPVVEKSYLIGLLSENDIQVIEDENDKIELHQDLIQQFRIPHTALWIDLLKQFVAFQSNILPVVDKDQLYLGYYDLNDVLRQFLETPFLNEDGILLVVEKNTTDYSFSEISQIVESNDAHLLGALVTKRDVDTVQITLKISNHDINNTIQTFRRYNYNVIAENLEDKYLEQLKNRSEYLQKYLNI